ncbi:hypothetical protein [Sediminitomix flava]|uniref:Uncharacterized protein n=1 Tax=Sediminitomix flava TaxID=379075 RepID=A0A315ZF95_SEDFL|nr:hypothetical protein [Sediminitomix flava]PWJ43843.1 hypothetical protein BC781_101189 [Sediminitomix flava]
MKQIHFIPTGKKRWFWSPLILLSCIFIISGLFEPIIFGNPKLYKYFITIGDLILVGFYSRIFWHKNSVQWNKLGMHIRLNSIFGKSISFADVKTAEIRESELIIIEKDNRKRVFNIKDVQKDDVVKLHKIIEKYSSVA